jgi:SAM-dependent methyltransferase
MLDVLRCPSCHADLTTLESCGSCGTAFGQDGGTPILIAPGSTSRHELVIEQGYYEDDQETLRRCLRTPPGLQQDDTLPYNMKPGHAAALAQLPAGSTVLEIGCGGGQNRSFVTGLGHRYLGTDISKTRSFDWLQRYGGPDLLCDAHFLPIKDQSVDAIYCSAMLQLVASPHIVLAEVARVLKPGGLFAGNVAFMEPWHDRSYVHMSPMGVIQLLRQGGLACEYLWPEKGYNGFYALQEMGNRFTRPLRFTGSLTYRIYRLEHLLKRRLRAEHRTEYADLMHQSVVSGAIEWIARKAPVADQAEDQHLRTTMLPTL